MPLSVIEFDVKLPRSQLWSLLNDLDKLGKCVPGCEEVEILGSQESRWKVKLSVGILSRRVTVKVRVLERLDPEKIVLKMESLDGDISGSWVLQLFERGADATAVKLEANMTAGGSFELIINQVIKSQLPRLAGQFADCIATKFGAGS